MNVERTSRQVIEHKLLTALEEGGTAAILVSEEDLEELALACEFFYSPKSMELARGLRQLQREAFVK